MRQRTSSVPEIESFNLADLDVAALDVRLELTTLIPACTLVICEGNTGGGSHCGTKCGVFCDKNAPHGCVEN